MKKISFIGILAVLVNVSTANAGYSKNKIQAEVLEGLDIVSVRTSLNNNLPEDAPGALGRDVYMTTNSVSPENTRLFIPTTMYVRAGAGLNLGFATDYAHIGRDNKDKYRSSGSYTTQIGLGWNLLSYVRTELDWQNMTFGFHNLDDARATYNTVGAMLYFDLAHRYVQTGDVTRVRHLVPFMGVGAGAGWYGFEGRDGVDGFVIAAPRAALGFNVMLTDLIGIDIMYQYQMMLGNGFGWDVRNGGADNISNIMASFRVNF